MVSNRSPVYIQYSQLLIGILALGFILYIGRNILFPLVFALILSILVNPIMVRFEKNHRGRIVAISVIVLSSFIIVCAVLYFIISQLANLSDALPQLEMKSHQISVQIVQWISDNFHISTTQINKWVVKIKEEGMSGGSLFIGQTISSITSILVFIFLVPVYMFMFLFYKPLLLEFVARLFPKDQHATVAEVLLESKKLIQSYLLGLAIEAVIMFVLNTTALLIIDIDYAILIGGLGALLNIIPYIGGVTSLLIALVFSLVTKDVEYAIWVFIAYSVIQFFDNNFIVPKIVASKVKVNALISLVVVFIGGALWGLPGMFLSLPVTAILKVIFDRIEALKPWGFLVGDTMPSIYGTIFKIRRRKSDQS